MNKKFKEKNLDTITRLDNYIKHNKNSILALVLSPEMIHNLCEYNGDDNELVSYRYNDVRIIVDYYSPVKKIRVITTNTPSYDFEVPCVWYI